MAHGVGEVNVVPLRLETVNGSGGGRRTVAAWTYVMVVGVCRHSRGSGQQHGQHRRCSPDTYIWGLPRKLQARTFALTSTSDINSHPQPRDRGHLSRSHARSVSARVRVACSRVKTAFVLVRTRT